MADLKDLIALDDELPDPTQETLAGPPQVVKAKPSSAFADISTDEDDPLTDIAAKVEAAGDLTKEWMRAYGLDHFKLVQSIDTLREVVDQCVASAHFGIDLETEGFDNRIEYDEAGKPYTIHKVVGYCLAVNGIGYYVPVRHEFDPRYGEQDPNVPEHLVNPEITRLCLACQPELVSNTNIFANSKPESKHPVACFFNAKFDQEFLYPITGLDTWHQDSFEDLYLAGYTVDTENGADTGLKEYSETLLTFATKSGTVPLKMIKFAELFPKECPPKDRHFKKLYPKLTHSGKPNAVVLYGCSDALCTLLLCLPKDQFPKGVARAKDLIEQVHTNRFKFTYTLEQKVTQTVRVMERARGLVDQAEIASVRAEAEQELAEIEAKIKEVAAKAGMPDFNPASFPQVAELLYDENRLDLNPKPEKTTTDQYKTTMKVLEDLVEELGADAPPVVRWVVIHRQINKAVGTYLTALSRDTDANGCLRYNFKQTGTATGRFTAPKGNVDHGFAGIPIQGIPARIDPRRPKCATSLRRVFIPREGYIIVKVDYAGQELRVVTNISKEPLWTKEFLGGSGDLHTLTAQAFWPGLKKSDPDFKTKRHAGKCVHPDTVIWVNGTGRTMGSLKFGVEDESLPADGTIWDGHRYRMLAATYNGGEKPLVHVITTAGVLTCSRNHRFELPNGGYLTADDLHPGVELAGMAAPQAKIDDLVRVDLDSPFYQIGLRGETRIPEEVLRASPEDQHQYLYGFGILPGRSKLRFEMQDLVLAGQLCGLLGNLGIGVKVTGIEGPGVVLVVGEGEAPSLNVVQRVVSAGTGPCVDVSLDEDPHRYVANGFLTHNTANFSLVYGGGVQAIMRATGVDKEEAAEKLAKFNGSVPVFAKWVENQHALVKQKLGVVSGFGRWMALPDAAITEKVLQERLKAAGREMLPSGLAKKEVNKIRAACERKSTNYPIQGSGADILKISLVALLDKLVRNGWLKTGRGGDDSIRMLMTVHDEVVFEVRKDRLQEAMPIIIDCMEYPSKLKADWPIPLIVEPLVGTSWDAKYDWLAIMDGKDPVPEVLAGYVTPNKPYQKEEKPAEAAVPTGETGSQAEPTPTGMTQEALDAFCQPVDTPSSPPPDILEALNRSPSSGVAYFTVSNPLTESVVESIGEGLEMSAFFLTYRPLPEDDRVVTLVLQTNRGDVLVDKDNGVKVILKRFHRYLTSCNIFCSWTLKDG